MIWIIASIPFWLLGGAFLAGSIAYPFRHRGLTTDRDVRVFVTGLLLAGILFIIAAKVAT